MILGYVCNIWLEAIAIAGWRPSLVAITVVILCSYCNSVILWAFDAKHGSHRPAPSGQQMRYTTGAWRRGIFGGAKKAAGLRRTLMK